MQEELDVDDEAGFLVRVTGFASKTTKDALLNFFENTRRSGGGEIKDIQLNHDEGFADIIFWSNQDAETVVQKDDLELDGAKLTTTLKKLPKELPVDQRRLHVVGISEKTTKDGLKSFMEVVSGGEVENILFGSNSDCMVSFKETVGFHEAQKLCKTNSLDDNFLKIEEVKICDCIEVSGLAANTTRDAVFYYFRNKRNGGGEVKSCEFIDASKKRMIISFEDPKVVDYVVRKDHVIDDVRLSVRRHYPFLGEASLNNPAGVEKCNTFTIDPPAMLFIKEFNSQEFDQLLQDHRVTYTWEPGSGEIILGCADPKMDKKTWEDSCDAVAAYINQIVKEKISIPREVWEQISDEAKEKCAAFENQMSMQHVFDFKTKENSIVLRGKTTDVCDLAKQLQNSVSFVGEQIMIEKSKVKKKVELSAVQMELLSCTGFFDGLKMKHADLEVTVISDSNDHEIHLRGLEEDVNDCTVFIWQTLSKVKENEMKLSTSVVSILGSLRGKAFLATSFKNNSIEAIINFDSSADAHVMMTARDRDHMAKAVNFIKSVVAEEAIPLDTNQKQVVESEKWKELKHSMQQSLLLQVTEEPATSRLLLVGLKENVDKAKENIEEFFDNNVILNRAIETETGCVRFLHEFRTLAMKNVEESLKEHLVTVSTNSGEGQGKIIVSGTKEGIKQAVPKIEMLIKSVKDDIVVLDTQGSSKINNDKEWWGRWLCSVEKKCSCVIEQCIEYNRDERWSIRPYQEGRTANVKIHIFAEDTFTIQKVEDEIKLTLKNDKNEDAERVSHKESPELDGSRLTLEEIAKEIPKDPYKLHVIGISEKTTTDGLESFMEVVSGEEVESTLFGSNSNAMVTFKEPPVVNDVTKRKHKINGTKLKVVPYYPFLGDTSPTSKVPQKKKTESPANKEVKRTPPKLYEKIMKEEEDDVCPICLDGFLNPTVLSKCKHKFCQKCIEQAFQHRKVCPTCGMVYGMQTGNMPPGTMNSSLEPYLRLSGYERYGTIRIDYHFPSGTQGPEHPNPGQWYGGTSRTAYLPDCPEGREVLGLLRKAFDARLTFTIGRSVITGASNVVTWGDIHHKTNPHGGATGFGYPDPTYLKRVKAELAAKGIN